MPVIFITAYADVPMAIRAMKSGAVEFVEKPFNRQTLLEKVQRAIKDDVERRRSHADREAIQARFRRLTEKEREVLDLIKAGRPNKAIATCLEITPRAVEMRRASLMKKLGVRSLVELLAADDRSRGAFGEPPRMGGERDRKTVICPAPTRTILQDFLPPDPRQSCPISKQATPPSPRALPFGFAKGSHREPKCLSSSRSDRRPRPFQASAGTTAAFYREAMKPSRSLSRPVSTFASPQGFRPESATPRPDLRSG